MGTVLGKMFLSLLMKLLTESFLARMTVYILGELAESTDNSLDDKIVAAVADGLGVKQETKLK